MSGFPACTWGERRTAPLSGRSAGHTENVQAKPNSSARGAQASLAPSAFVLLSVWLSSHFCVTRGHREQQSFPGAIALGVLSCPLRWWHILPCTPWQGSEKSLSLLQRRRKWMFWGELSGPPRVASGRTGEEGPHPFHNKLKMIVVNVVFYYQCLIRAASSIFFFNCAIFQFYLAGDFCCG